MFKQTHNPKAERKATRSDPTDNRVGVRWSGIIGQNRQSRDVSIDSDQVESDRVGVR